MSQQDWLLHMGRLNYYAGQLSAHGGYHVACAQARELADQYERLAQSHDALQLASPTMDLGAFIDMATSTQQPCFELQPVRPASAFNGFVHYTKAEPCPDMVAPSGTSKGKKKSAAHKPLPAPPPW